MAANINPIFPLTPMTTWPTTPLTTANTAKDGTGTVALLATGGVNGTRIDQIKVRALGSNVATVMRFFINNGQANTTAANNALVHEITCPATTLSEVAALADLDVVIYKGGDVVPPIQVLPVGYRLYATIGTTVSAGLMPVVSGGDF